MLPFLKKQNEASVGSASEPVKRKTDEDKEEEGSYDFLEAVMEELFQAKDAKARAEAFRAAFQLLEQEPHEETNG